MRVLMLGWEFPPHISGGLGTACRGLVEGITQQEVDVLFVLPRAHGDEHVPGAEIVGCNEREQPLPAPPPRGETPAPQPAPRGSAPTGDMAISVPPPPRFRTIAVGSTLTPYATPERRASDEADAVRYAATRTAWTDLIRTTAAPESESEASVAPAPPDEDAPPSFTGSYGPGLMDEVARYTRVVAEIAGTASFDVIHAHDWMTFPAGAAIAAASGKPLVAHIHASEYDRSPDAPNPEVLALEQLGLDAADRVICVSHFTARRIQERYDIRRSDIRVVHNAVTQSEQEREWHLERSVDEPVVLFLGRVTGQKGPAYFLEAAQRVVALRPEVKFVMSGSGDMLPGMVELSAKLGIERSVHFTGFLRGADVERMFGMADVYVMPSVSEPFGISPLEAMAQDVPVIVSRQSGVSEILTHALKVDFWDVEELANKILAVLERPSLRNMLVEEGRDEVERMRWEERGLRVKRVYEELVS